MLALQCNIDCQSAILKSSLACLLLYVCCVEGSVHVT